MASILGPQGVKPDMKFRCMDCGDIIPGQDVINRTQDLYIVSVPKDTKPTPENIGVRCECCHDDHLEKHCHCDDEPPTKKPITKG